jgi:hypothetical protein
MMLEEVGGVLASVRASATVEVVAAFELFMIETCKYF